MSVAVPPSARFPLLYRLRSSVTSAAPSRVTFFQTRREDVVAPVEPTSTDSISFVFEATAVVFHDLDLKSRVGEFLTVIDAVATWLACKLNPCVYVACVTMSAMTPPELSTIAIVAVPVTVMPDPKSTAPFGCTSIPSVPPGFRIRPARARSPRTEASPVPSVSDLIEMLEMTILRPVATGVMIIFPVLVAVR